MTITILAENLAERQAYLRADRNQYTVCLKEQDPEWLIKQSFPHIIKGIEKRSTLVDLAVTVGRRIRQKLKLKRDGVSSCQVGFFIIIAFIEVGLIGYKLRRVKKKNGKTSKFRTYEVIIKDKKKLFDLWDVIKEEEVVDLYPTKEPTEPWTSGLHPTGAGIVKKSSMEFLKQFSPEKQPMIFSSLNKLGSTPWRVNHFILDVVKYYMNCSEEERNPLKYRNEKDPQKKQSLYVVVSSCIRIAENNLNNDMYDLYNLDFRGRIYCNRAFYHEQGDDVAKAMLLHSRGSEIGENGAYWLYLHGANVYGFDKAPLDERVQFVEDRLSEFLSYAEDPFQNTGWMDADKPLSFLAFCQELNLFSRWIGEGKKAEAFITNLVCYFDGSNNGCQHLSALSLDEEIGKHVNLVPSDTIGDLYMFIADKVWERLKKEEEKVSKAVKDQFDEVFEKLIELQKKYDRAEAGTELKAQAWEELQTYRNNKRKIREAMFSIFWNRVTDPKERRKIAKRPTMTIALT